MKYQGDYALFAEEFKRKPNSTWIMKPTSRSQGRGIFIFQKLSQISKWKSENRWKPEKEDAETYVVQRYISNPFLVGGRKVRGGGNGCCPAGSESPPLDLAWMHAEL